MSQDKNTFGGGNPHSLYVPMSDLEQEVLARIIESNDLHIHILGWGVAHNPRVVFGDARISLYFTLAFDRPDQPIPVYGFDLELRTGAGLLLFKAWQNVMYDNKPIPCGAGIHYDVAWDIQIQHMDPKVVKAFLPGALGLTSRVIDKDTGAPSITGNMKLSSTQRQQIHQLRQGEASVRNDDAQKNQDLRKKTS